LLFYILYNLVVLVGLILLWPVGLLWLMVQPKVRAGLFEKWGLYSRAQQDLALALPVGRRTWVHAVSVGELNAAQPFIDALEAAGHTVILSNTTRTGHDLAASRYPQHLRLYAPFDLPQSVLRAISLVQPQQMVFLETELWPNWVFIAKRFGIDCVLVNGRLSERSYTGYARFAWFFKWVLSQYHTLLMQSQADAERIISLGAPPEGVQVMGNLKYDLPPALSAEERAALRAQLPFEADAPILIAGSTHPADETYVLDVYQSLLAVVPQLKLIWVPRHPERFEAVAHQLKQSGLAWARRSQLQGTLPVSVLLGDTMGELNALYAVATAAWMGGSWSNTGGHNPVEPLHQGVPVVTGPDMKNFAAMMDVLAPTGAVQQVSYAQQAIQILAVWLTQPERRDQAVAQAQAVLATHTGATKQAVSVVDAIQKKKADA
jgi:3-deoxy-D-manno-octulosonic-acid transferase